MRRSDKPQRMLRLFPQESQIMNNLKIYPLNDRPTSAELDLLNDSSPNVVITTGEYRKPKAGEWYISGAIPAGYRANCDLNYEYHIAKLTTKEAATIEYYTKKLDHYKSQINEILEEMTEMVLQIVN